jgi:hypothetical protein
MQGQVVSPRIAPFETVRIGIGPEDRGCGPQAGRWSGPGRCKLRIYRCIRPLLRGAPVLVRVIVRRAWPSASRGEKERTIQGFKDSKIPVVIVIRG